MTAATLMIQGTASNVGKSLVTAGICRLLARSGHRVAPFKAQNMSLNAAVTAAGAEIGRAQALQALAAGIEPTADMNPILLKPEGESRSQVVVLGKPWQSLSALDYETRKAALGQVIADALTRLRTAYDIVVIEGAGSPVELNLKLRDLANMFVAELADAPVLLVADIDRGGIFASILGTLDLLEPHERARVRGLVVNKFRGDPALFRDGRLDLERRAGIPVLGVLPYLQLHLPGEDSLALADMRAPDDTRPTVAIVQLPRLANFDDFLPLEYDGRIRVAYARRPEDLAGAAAVILPGSKATVADLRWLYASGMAKTLHDLAAGGQPIVGICGGCQMLGRRIVDGIESDLPDIDGLDLLPIETRFATDKRTVRLDFRGLAGWLAGVSGSGYEIHAGRIDAAQAEPWLEAAASDGAPYAAGWWHGNVWGTMVHGLFDHDDVRHAFVSRCLGATESPTGIAYHDALLSSLDALADAIDHEIGYQRLLAICRIAG